MIDIDPVNLGIRDGDVDDMDWGTGGVSCTEADTREARTKNVDQRENLNHIRFIDDILIDEGSENEFELLVGESNHNASHDTTGNNTIMPHPSVNENSKTNRNPKKWKNDQTKKETNVEYTLKKLKLLVWVNVKT